MSENMGSTEGIERAEDLKSLPAVGRSFVQNCKKCATERLHKVMVHTDEKSGKVECEICHKKSTFKIKAPPKAKSPSTRKKASTPSRNYEEEWNSLREKNSGKGAKPYRLAEKFEKDVMVDHPKFGVGIVMTATDQRLEILFKEGLKTLVHNQKSN